MGVAGGVVFDLDALFRQKVDLDDEMELQQYVALFREQGFTDWDSVKMLTNDDLKELGMQKMGHRKKTLAAIQQCG